MVSIKVSPGSIEEAAASRSLTFDGSTPDGQHKYTDLGMPRLWAAFQAQLKQPWRPARSPSGIQYFTTD